MGKLIAPPFATWPWLKWSEEHGDQIALCDNDKEWTWAEVSIQVNRYANGLIQQEVKRYEVVAAVAHNCIELVWLQLACIRIGARFVAINPKIPESQLYQLVTSISVNHMWFGQGQKTISGTWRHLQLINAQYAVISVTWQPNRLATLTFTSGSTGLPKAVAHSANNHLFSAIGLLSAMAFEKNDSWLLSLPLFHVSGLAIVWRWLLTGACIVMPTEKGLLEDLYGVTHASLVPTQLQRILDSCDVSRLALKRVLLGGSAISAKLTTKAAENGIESWVGYGMTEMASTVTAKLANEQLDVGTALHYRELRVEDTGEILVRGQCLALGYYHGSKMVNLTDKDGWYPTGDLGCVKGEKLYILGRIDNMFISGGENIHPEKIEIALLTHDEIEQAIVVDVVDDEFGHRPVAVIKTENTMNHDQLNEFLKDKLTRFEYPIRYEIMPEHLLGTGIKISRPQVKEWVNSQQNV